VNNTEIQKLIDGFGRFHTKHFKSEDSLYSRLSREGQSPRIMVIACCDSRVDPAIITDCDPGDLFVVRNVANLVPPHETAGHYHGTSAALEFAVRILDIHDVIVLGHSRCGGIHTLIHNTGTEEGVGQFIKPWMAIADKARTAALTSGAVLSPDDAARKVEQAAIGISLQNLMTFPWVRERVEHASLHLHGWYFDMEHGQLLRYNPTTNSFELLQ
jgi:carbonic anhydrase